MNTTRRKQLSFSCQPVFQQVLPFELHDAVVRFEGVNRSER